MTNSHFDRTLRYVLRFFRIAQAIDLGIVLTSWKICRLLGPVKGPQGFNKHILVEVPVAKIFIPDEIISNIDKTAFN